MNPTLLPNQLKSHPDFEDLSSQPGLRFDLKYASLDNFTGQNIYGDFRIPYLHKIASQMLKNAVVELQKQHPGFSFLIFDVLRPLSAQQKLWDHVVGTAQQDYIADPVKRSIHNFGMAVDLTVIDERGQALDMGTEFDSFQDLAQPQLESRFLQEGRLLEIHVKNRLILRRAMLSAGFLQLPHEWWHYNAESGDDVRAQYSVIL